MAARLPLFPLGTVLFPGVPLPLHIFEERYRLLIRDLLALPERDRKRFGVIAIREGREVGADGVRALHEVGCTAELRQVQAYDDGRFDVLTVGVARFTVLNLDRSAPYLQGDVDFLPETSGPGVADLASHVGRSFLDYLELLGTARGLRIEPPELPPDPLLLSYLVAATVLLDINDKQELLAAPDAGARLRVEAELLHRESALLRTLSAVPPLDRLQAGNSPN